jgi:hypothetical protein
MNDCLILATTSGGTELQEANLFREVLSIWSGALMFADL